MRDYLRCPACRGNLQEQESGLRCARCSRTFPVHAGIPALLLRFQDNRSLSASKRRLGGEAALYPLQLAVFGILGRVWLPAERRRLVSVLGLKRGDWVLDHCSGTGSNLPAIAAGLGVEGTIVAMDLSRDMLQRAQRRAQRLRVRTAVHQADAAALPYDDCVFDAVIHVGAINQFGNGKRRAVAEIVRVTRPGGTVAIVDEGLEPSRVRTLLGRLLVRRNGLFASRPPLDALPAGIHPEVRWLLNGIFYQVVFRVPDA